MVCGNDECSNDFEVIEESQKYCCTYCSKRARASRRHARKAIEVGRPGCTRPYKRVYTSELEALTELSVVTEKLSDPLMRAYLCGCGAWHHGHPIRESGNTVDNLSLSR